MDEVIFKKKWKWRLAMTPHLFFFEEPDFFVSTGGRHRSWLMIASCLITFTTSEVVNVSCDFEVDENLAFLKVFTVEV